MIEVVRKEDIDDIVNLAKAFRSESIYSNLSFDADKFRAIVSNTIDNNQFGVCYKVDGVIVGAMLGYIAEHFFSSDLIAGEYGVFVSPEHRGGMAFVRMIRMFEQWAIDNGAKIINLGVSAGIHADRIGSVYERLGYGDKFVVYRKI